MMFSTVSVVTLSVLSFSPSSAASIRGGNSPLCENELDVGLACQPDCNFTSRTGTCESKFFMYHGGSCRLGLGDAVSVEKSLDVSIEVVSNCTDLHQGPPSIAGESVFVVISDVEDPWKNSSTWTTVGGFFGTDFHDYPIGEGLDDAQNITFYSSEDTTYQNMLQTLIFTAPCEGTPLENFDGTQSVQLFGTTIDPDIHASFNLQVTSKTDQDWVLKSVSYAMNVDPFYQSLQVDPLEGNIGMDGFASIPIEITIERGLVNELGLLFTATATRDSDGLECHVTTLHNSSNWLSSP